MSETSFIRPDAFWQDIGLRAGQSVIHLGCGAGFYIIPAAKIVGVTGKVVGIDIMPHLVAASLAAAIRHKVKDWVEVLRADIEVGTNLPSSTFHWVLIANILHQAEADKILAEAARLIKTDTGSVVVAEWNTAATPLGPPPAVRLSQAHVIELAQAHGLSVHRNFTPSPYHFGLVCMLKK